MIKDILVNLSIDGKGDPAADYAIAIATALEAHLAAVAFSYEPIMPLTVMGGAPANFIDAQRRENDAAAQAAEVDRNEGDHKGRAVRVEFEGGVEPIDFQVVDSGSEVILARPDLGIRYHLTADQAHRLLSLPEPESKPVAAPAEKKAAP